MQGKTKTKELLYRHPDKLKKKLDGDLNRKSRTRSL